MTIFFLFSTRGQPARYLLPRYSDLLNMTNILNFSSLAASMQLLTVSNKITKPEDGFVFRQIPGGVDKDGETIRVVDMETEFKNNLSLLFFFPIDFKVDSFEVLSFKKH